MDQAHVSQVVAESCEVSTGIFLIIDKKFVINSEGEELIGYTPLNTLA